jgi:hypothetical protein
MKKGTFVSLVAAIVTAATLTIALPANAQAAAQSIDKPVIHPAWTGVWQGNLDGVPAVILTLANDAGEANGTIVFHAIKKENGHAFSFSTEPHTLLHPRIEGNTLSFQVIRGNGSAEVLNMSVELSNDGNIQFACSNCGPEGTKAELDRLQ